MLCITFLGGLFMPNIVSRSVFSNGVSMSTMSLSAETRLDTHGNIITTIGSPSEYAICCFPFSLKNIKWRLIILLAIWLTIVFIPNTPINLSYIMLLSGQAILSLMIALPVLVRLFTKERTLTALYHTALHQVLNSYNNLGRVPTIEEAKKHSVISENCFIHKNLEIIFRQIPTILLAFTLDGNISSLILFLFFYCFWELFLFSKVKNKKFMQILERAILVKPTDQELQVAIECLTLVTDETLRDLAHEKNNFYVSSINPSPSSHN